MVDRNSVKDATESKLDIVVRKENLGLDIVVTREHLGLDIVVRRVSK